jgi:hypothetical protein
MRNSNKISSNQRTQIGFKHSLPIAIVGQVTNDLFNDRMEKVYINQRLWCK